MLSLEFVAGRKRHESAAWIGWNRWIQRVDRPPVHGNVWCKGSMVFAKASKHRISSAGRKKAIDSVRKLLIFQTGRKGSFEESFNMLNGRLACIRSFLWFDGDRNVSTYRKPLCFRFIY